MCLLLKSDDIEKEKKIADRDIACYKIIIGLKKPQTCDYPYKLEDVPFSDGVSLQSLPQYFSNIDDPDLTASFRTPFMKESIKFGVRMTDSAQIGWVAETNAYYNYANDNIVPAFSAYEILLIKYQASMLKMLGYKKDRFEMKDAGYDGSLCVNDFRISNSLINGGIFHSFINEWDAAKVVGNDDYCLWIEDFVGIAECVIPKGAEYYEGVFDYLGVPSYGSREIVYNGILKLWAC